MTAHKQKQFPPPHLNSSSITDPQDSHSQSFSSTLLEHIYRSFDDDTDFGTNQRTKSTSKKSNAAVDRWIESENVMFRRKLAPPPVDVRRCKDRRQINHCSSTSSSGSSSGVGGFSSSDTESAPAILKPIRTAQEIHRKIYSDEVPMQKTKQSKEGNLQRRALKLYSELKKVKQPISPGGKLTGFLNSLFHSKKGNISLSSSGVLKLETESPATTSRSCLSKTPSSAGRIQRSVRFVDNNERGNERKHDVSMRDSSNLANHKDFKLQIKEKQKRVEEVAKKLLKNYHHHNRKELKVNDHIVPEARKFDSRNNIVNEIHNNEDEDEDDDISCGSSDLFELENFPEIGMVDMYDEELPVYETTHVDTNRAIANGFIL